MSAKKNLLLMAGDGIGPEVMAQAKRVLEWLQKTGRENFENTEDLVGGASIDAHGVPLTDEALAHALAARANFWLPTISTSTRPTSPWCARLHARFARLPED